MTSFFFCLMLTSLAGCVIAIAASNATGGDGGGGGDENNYFNQLLDNFFLNRTTLNFNEFKVFLATFEAKLIDETRPIDSHQKCLNKNLNHFGNMTLNWLVFKYSIDLEPSDEEKLRLIIDADKLVYLRDSIRSIKDKCFAIRANRHLENEFHSKHHDHDDHDDHDDGDFDEFDAKQSKNSIRIKLFSHHNTTSTSSSTTSASNWRSKAAIFFLFYLICKMMISMKLQNLSLMSF